jgi:hypothetical protein
MKLILKNVIMLIGTVVFLWVLISLDTAQADTPEDFAKRLIVRVTCKNGAGAGIIIGVVGENAYIATADHILGMDTNCDLEFEFYQMVPISALAERRFPHPIDMAILRAPLPGHFPKDKIPLSEITCTQANKGDLLHVIGHPGGDFWNIPKKVITFQEGDRYAGMIKFNFSCPPGYSGGGLFSENWRLLGMVLQQDGEFCVARDIISMQSKIQEHIFGIKCSNFGLLSTLKKIKITSSAIEVGIITNLTGPYAGQSEYQRIRDYFNYINGGGGINGKKVGLFAHDGVSRHDIVVRAIIMMKSKNCPLVIVDSSVASPDRVEKIIQQNGMEAYLVKRGEHFDN